MTSIAKIGTAMGQMVMPPLIAFLIISFGWRTATFYLGIVASIGLVLAASLMSTPNISSKKLVSEDANLEVLDKKFLTFWLSVSFVFSLLCSPL